MQNFDLCKHGVPVKVQCRWCAEDKEIAALPEDHPKCKHGVPEGYCVECRDELQRQQHVEKRKIAEAERLKHIRTHPEHLLKKCGVPPKYLNCSFDSFIGNDKLVLECKKDIDQGIFLTGKTGCGKTHLAVAMLRELAKEDKPSMFKNVSELLLEIRGSFREGSETTEQELVEKYSAAPVLVLDDLGSEKSSEFAINTLYIIINHRDQELLPTIITSNLTLEQVETKLNARIASRVSGTRNIKINMQDYRKKR